MKVKRNINLSLENSCASALSSVLCLTQIFFRWRNLPTSLYSRNNKFWAEIWPIIFCYWRSLVLWSCSPILGHVNSLNDKKKKKRQRLGLKSTPILFDFLPLQDSPGFRKSINLPVLYVTVSKKASSNAKEKKRLTTLQLEKCWGGNSGPTLRKLKAYLKKVGICIL